MLLATEQQAAYIFESSKADSTGKDRGVSNPPLCVPRLVVITDSDLCHHWDLQTLEYMPRPGHAIPSRQSGWVGGREGGREGGTDKR